MKKISSILFILAIFQFGVAYSQNLLLNAGFEDPDFMNNWNMAKLTGGDGTIVAAGASHANTGNEACKVTTTLVNTNFGKFGLKSDNYPSSAKEFTATVMAKTDSEGVSAGLGFKFQIVAVTTTGTNKYFASTEQKLTDTYQEYTYTKDASGLGLDFVSVRVAVQCSGYLGNYFFDDFILDSGSIINADTTIVPVEITPISNITTSEKVVAFTFDDGPDSELTGQIAKVFEDNNGRATFFNIGNNLINNIETVAQLLNAGHEIGNHSMSHSRLPDYESDADIINDIVGFQDLYKSTFNYTPKLFRAPFLDYGQIREGDEVTPLKDDRVGGVLTTEDLIAVNASLYANDASADQTAANIIDKIESDIKNGDIILCHERSHTLEAIQSIIPALKAQGYKFITVSELLRVQEGWTTISPHDPKIKVEGSNYTSNENSELIMHRHSDKAYAGTNLSNRFNPVKARTGSGIILHFKTASPTLNVKLKIREGNSSSSTFGIFRNGEQTDTVIISYDADKEFSIELNSNVVGEEVLYSVTMPIWTDVSCLGLELENGYELVDFELIEKPVYVAYGNSITHGRGQNGAYETYPYLVSEMFGWELFNLAVGGGKTSVVMGEMIRDDFDKIDVLTVLIGYNDYNGEGSDVESYIQRYNAFLDTVRTGHPETKIFCISLTHTTNLVSEASGINVEDFRTAVENIVSERVAAGDMNIFLIKGDELTTEESLQDPVHLSLQGASDFADSLFAHMKPFFVDEATSINENSSELSGGFPNPFKDYVIIKNVKKNSTIQITDISGQVLKTFYSKEKSPVLNLSDLPSGIYFISHETEFKRTSSKFMK